MCFGHGQTTTELYFNLLSLGWTISRDKINCYTSKISGLCDKMFHRNPSKFSFLILRYFNLFSLYVQTRESITEKNELHRFSYFKCMSNFEGFRRNISSRINLLLLMSLAKVLTVWIWSHYYHFEICAIHRDLLYY